MNISFFKNEYKALAGLRRRTIMALCSILFFTFLALGYAVGSLGNLQKKMDNPFTNWVDVEVGGAIVGSQNLDELKKRYNDPAVTELFQLKDMTGWVKFYQKFNENGYDPLRQPLDTLTRQLSGRSIDPSELLLAKVLEPKNVVYPAQGFDPADFGEYQLIVTEEMLRSLRYNDPANVSNLCLYDSDNKAPLYVPIAAIVQELPSFCKFLCTPKLYNILKAKNDGVRKCQDLIITNNKEGANVFYLLTEEGDAGTRLEEFAGSYFEGKNPSLSVESEIKTGDKKLQTCRLAFLPVMTPILDSVRLFLDKARKDGIAVSELAAIEEGANMCAGISAGDFHYLAFNFDRLDSIRAFSKDMRNIFKYDVDMAQVAAKENFALVSRLTFAISFILLGFGILSIVLFVNNLLRTHLFEVRANLGTFQAFGLNNRFLLNIYLKIIFSFLALAVSVALLLAVVIDRTEQLVMQEESRFNIFSFWILASIAGLMSIGLWISNRTIRHMLNDTPGNLIYER